MAVVSVAPEVFEVVSFDAGEIASVADQVATEVGLPADEVIRIVVDEQSMLSQATLVSVDPIEIHAHGGALEDRARPRQLSKANVIDEMARLLQRVVDRRSLSYVGAPAESELSPQQMMAWDVHCLGRTARWQQRSFHERHRYDFALKCGFTPEAAQAFEQLWAADDLGWAGVAALTPAPPIPQAKPTPARRR
ncbi:MAG: hypothetical protein NVS3B12_24050 [Acidimicrobiales bacterium]